MVTREEFEAVFDRLAEKPIDAISEMTTDVCLYKITDVVRLMELAKKIVAALSDMRLALTNLLYGEEAETK